ncbi:MAG: Fe-S cluster assembly protein IscX [Alphaproteobacteria bacterium]|nr:Fe-S cluster assembly protein IscX [Alphaproteobacteria bacterium]
MRYDSSEKTPSVLTWSDTAGLAAALCAAYPDADRLSLDPQALIPLVLDLPAFYDPAPPPGQRALQSVLWTWMRLADDGGVTVV